MKETFHPYKIFTILLILFFPFSVFSEKKNTKNKIKETIIVTASRIPADLSETGRIVTIITGEEIKNSPATSVQELLKYVTGIDLRRRGISGIQADLSMRGADFEQFQIMIDGVKFNNPQTGHHNLDIPLSLEDIERIEILRGHGSSSFGANAVGGIINIITRKSDTRKIGLKTEYGSFKTKAFGFNLSLPGKTVKSFISFNKGQSDGYKSGTEYDKKNFFGNFFIMKGKSKFSVSSAFSDKKFGAFSFYTKKFPDQWENTSGGFLSGKILYESKKNKLKFAFYHINHKDYFILDRYNPDFYSNKHITVTNGMDFQLSFFHHSGIFVIGGNFESNSIKSNSLGNHNRETISLFFQQRTEPLQNFYIDSAIYLYNYSDWGWKIIPSLIINFLINENTELFFNTGKSFRIPSFTELYYNSPANMGNINLSPEKSIEYETGMKSYCKSFTMQASIFFRKIKDKIDWVRKNREEKWKAQNITGMKNFGVETTISLYLKGVLFKHLKMGFVHIKELNKINKYESKYIWDSMKNQLTFELSGKLFSIIKYKINLRYMKRLSGYSYLVVDSYFSKEINSTTRIFFKINNLTDREYFEAGGIPMPGRWIIIGFEGNL